MDLSELFDISQPHFGHVELHEVKQVWQRRHVQTSVDFEVSGFLFVAIRELYHALKLKWERLPKK
jgi:hypothetical protein